MCPTHSIQKMSPYNPPSYPVPIILLQWQRKMKKVVLLYIPVQNRPLLVMNQYFKALPWKNHSSRVDLTLLMFLKMMLTKNSIHRQMSHWCKRWRFFLPGLQHSLDLVKRHSIGSSISCTHSYYLLATNYHPPTARHMLWSTKGLFRLRSMIAALMTVCCFQTLHRERIPKWLCVQSAGRKGMNLTRRLHARGSNTFQFDHVCVGCLGIRQCQSIFKVTSTWMQTTRIPLCLICISRQRGIPSTITMGHLKVIPVGYRSLMYGWNEPIFQTECNIFYVANNLDYP